MGGSQKYLFAVCGRLIATFAQLALVSLIAARFDLQTVGTIMIAMSSAQVINAALDFGLSSQALVRSRSSAFRRALSTSALSRLFIISISGVWGIVASSAGRQQDAILSATLIACTLESLSDLGIMSTMGNGKPSKATTVLILRKGASLALFAWLSLSMNPVVIFLFIGSLNAGFAILNLWGLLGRPLSIMRLWRINRRYFGVALMANLFQLDVVVIGVVVGARLAGLYAPATRLIGPVSQLMNVLMQVFIPKLRSLKDVPLAQVKYFLKAERLVFLAVLILVFSSPLWPHLVVALFGQKYSSGAAVAVAVAFVCCAILVGQLQLAWFSSTGIPKVLPRYLAATSLTGLILIYICSTVWALMGASFALVAAQVLAASGLIYMRRTATK